MNTQKGPVPVAIILAVVGILLVGSGAYYLVKNYKSKPVENPVTSENIQKTTQPEQPTLPTQPKEQPTSIATQQPPPTTSTDETANWKTYIDTNQNWEIKLPPSYSIDYSFYAEEIQNQIKKQLNEEGKIIKGNFYLDNYEYSIIFLKYLDKPFLIRVFGGDKPTIGLSISRVNKKPANISMFDYVNNSAKPYYEKELGFEIKPIENLRKIEIGDKQVIVGGQWVFEGCPEKEYWIEKDKESYIEINVGYCFTLENFTETSSLYDILFDIKNENLHQINNELNQILSTFKFIK